MILTRLFAVKENKARAVFADGENNAGFSRRIAKREVSAGLGSDQRRGDRPASVTEDEAFGDVGPLRILGRSHARQRVAERGGNGKQGDEPAQDAITAFQTGDSGV
jgi:hypothetical protein